MKAGVHRREALLAAFASLPALACGQPKKARAPTQAPLESLGETKDVLKGFRELASRTSSGMNLAAYSAAIADLKVNVDALDEVLQARGEAALRQQLAAAFGPYQDAKTIWAGCVSYCDGGLLILHAPTSPLDTFAAKLVDANEAMNRSADEGGVLMPGGGRRVYYTRLVGALMSLGRERYETLRSALLVR